MRIQTQFSLAFIPLLVLSGIGTTVIARREVHKALVEEAAERGQAELGGLASAVAPGIQAAQESLLLPILTAAVRRGGAEYMMVMDAQGQILANTDVLEKGKRYRDPATLEALSATQPAFHEVPATPYALLDVSWPVWADASGSNTSGELRSLGIKASRQRIGTLRMGLRLGRVRHISRQIGLLLLIVDALLLGFALFIVRKILRPIDDLVAVTEDISQGMYGKILPVPATSELGRLAKGFNRMSAILAQATAARESLTKISTTDREQMPKIKVSYRRPRILFFGEAVTLAHVVRPLTLAKSLDPARYDVFFACDPRFSKLYGDLPFSTRPIHSMPSEEFFRALQNISPIYDEKKLRAYIKEDLAVIQEIGPDLIIGDFRLSLPVSAPLARCPSMQIVNAYWNPLYTQDMPVPDEHKAPLLLFELFQPLVLAWHNRPINRLRRENKLPPLRHGVGQMRIWADHVLYPEIQEMFPMADQPKTHHYLGPILWSPNVLLPSWWDHLPADKPIVYVGMGSSGLEKVLPILLESLTALPVTVMVATGGRVLPQANRSAIYAADYLPGDQAAARAALVICNGGSPATQQALVMGKPVLGIASNIDQCMNMEAVSRTRAGEMLQAEAVTIETVKACVMKMLDEPSYREAAQHLSKLFSTYNASDRFRAIVDELFGNRPAENGD